MILISFEVQLSTVLSSALPCCYGCHMLNDQDTRQRPFDTIHLGDELSFNGIDMF